MFKTWLKLNDKVTLSMETYNTLEEAQAAAQIIHNNSHKLVYIVELKIVGGIEIRDQSGSNSI